jgi:arabinan endo-1,5-alpha-L-arabinosidase
MARLHRTLAGSSLRSLRAGALSLGIGLVGAACGGTAGQNPGDSNGGGSSAGASSTGGSGGGGSSGALTGGSMGASSNGSSTGAGSSGANSGSDSVDASASSDASVRADAQASETGSGSPDGGPRCGGAVLGTGPETTTATHLDIGVHDPSMIWDGSRFYLFATGGTLGVRSSADILAYANAGSIFNAVPVWVTTALGMNPGSLWAPDVSYFGGQFHVYYAGSTFGSNSSVIGLATTPSLKTPQWTDQGLIVQSKTSDTFNAIDPNVAFDETCSPWLAYGSFWSGIKMRQIDPSTGNVSTTNTTQYSLASRNGGAIEAASIISHNGFYYLFVSFDACCKGVNSTYRTMVGRAKKITGPYTDKAGADMMTGAAEQLLATSGRYIGPGGGTAWRNGDSYLYAYHYYDGQANGASKLQIRPINFDAQDWIVLGDSLFP